MTVSHTEQSLWASS